MSRKPLVIQVESGEIPHGDSYKWTDFTDFMPKFTKAIITPEILIKGDDTGKVNIGNIVSGMPSIFARANLFSLALNYVTDQNQSTAGLLDLYKSLVNEWRGFIGCIALDYANIDIERVYLKYSDGKPVSETKNIYEPKGAFGNLLFGRRELWCDQDIPDNEPKIPFIDIIKYKHKGKETVIGGTSPDSFLFTSVSYKITEKAPFIDIQSGKFTDPLNSDLSSEQILPLHGYVCHLINQIDEFKTHYSKLSKSIQPQTGNIDNNLRNWKTEIERYAAGKKINLANTSIPPSVNKFKKPFSILFNYSAELYGSEGIISDKPEGLENPILFDPQTLLLPKNADIARIDFGSEAAKDPSFLRDLPVFVLKATSIGMEQPHFQYFALPLSPLGLNIFGKNVGALVRSEEYSAVRSSMAAEYDVESTSNNLKVKLKLYTVSGKEYPLEVAYSVNPLRSVKGHDVLIWPNFISKQWGRYFMYSEIPHNTTSPTCPFKTTPFVGNVEDDFFRILTDNSNNPVYLAEGGRISIPPGFEKKVKAKLHITADNRTADNGYKYEIYESNQPFKGIRFNCEDKESGYLIIRYSSLNKNIPHNYLQEHKTLSPAYLGIDFGSTNSSIAYYSERTRQVADKIELKNRRVSLLSLGKRNNDIHPAQEDEIFFFQNDEIQTNAIKSVLTIHDQRRLVQDSQNINPDPATLAAQAIKGGFPCFEKNLPIDIATENRYQLLYRRSGTANIVHNMKWSTQDIEKAHKQAYLSTLLLHIYAQLFDDNHAPTTLKWSYPSAMSTHLLSQYHLIWEALKDISPLNEHPKLEIYEPTSNIFSNITNDKNQEASESKFNFQSLGDKECLTEACAVANYIVSSRAIETSAQYLTLCFDIGGSTTDISALCNMADGSAMVKQNSIRFAAQRLSHATQFSAKFKSVLLKICERKQINIQGLNTEPSKFSSQTAPYYFEQIIDRLDESDFQYFYQLIKAECPELMSVNLYITGLIMYYAGQLAYKLIPEIKASDEKHPEMDNWKPIVNIVFAGKGARIFDWIPSVNHNASEKYYRNLFALGFGGYEKVKSILSEKQPIIINPTNKDGFSNVKYEVSKGLALPTKSLLIPQNKKAIEILGEEGFVFYDAAGNKTPLPYDTNITNEMMGQLGKKFLSAPEDGKSNCPKFEEFAKVFYEFSTGLFGRPPMPIDIFKNSFLNLNINTYIENLPEYREAVERNKNGSPQEFDFVAPIIILEGMKFYDDFLLKELFR